VPGTCDVDGMRPVTSGEHDPRSVGTRHVERQGALAVGALHTRAYHPPALHLAVLAALHGEVNTTVDTYSQSDSS